MSKIENYDDLEDIPLINFLKRPRILRRSKNKKIVKSEKKIKHFSLEFRDIVRKKRKKTPPDLPDYSIENVNKCLNIVLGSLKSSGLKEKANVIQKVFENRSDIWAIKLNNIIGKRHAFKKYKQFTI